MLAYQNHLYYIFFSANKVMVMSSDCSKFRPAVCVCVCVCDFGGAF